MRDMKSYLRALAPLLLLGGAQATVAQMYQPAGYPDRPVQWFIDMGASIPTGQTSDDFDTG